MTTAFGDAINELADRDMARRRKTARPARRRKGREPKMFTKTDVEYLIQLVLAAVVLPRPRKKRT